MLRTGLGYVVRPSLNRVGRAAAGSPVGGSRLLGWWAWQGSFLRKRRAVVSAQVWPLFQDPHCKEILSACLELSMSSGQGHALW